MDNTKPTQISSHNVIHRLSQSLNDNNCWPLHSTVGKQHLSSLYLAPTMLKCKNTVQFLGFCLIIRIENALFLQMCWILLHKKRERKKAGQEDFSTNSLVLRLPSSGSSITCIRFHSFVCLTAILMATFFQQIKNLLKYDTNVKKLGSAMTTLYHKTWRKHKFGRGYNWGETEL